MAAGMAKLVESSSSAQRIENFFLMPEMQSKRISGSSKHAIKIKNGSFFWQENKPALSNINLRVPQGKFVVIIGKAGSGKSSLLSAILGEISVLEGNVEVNGDLAYAPQSAWLRNESLQDNVIFEQLCDRSRFSKAIKVSCLGPDIGILPDNEMTLIGEEGVNLSGGQKQRINLARCYYANRSIVLLDDPLSALDASVGREVLQNLILRDLKEKTRVLVTHNLDPLQYADFIYVLSEGRIVESGTYPELMEQQPTCFANLMRDYLLGKKVAAEKSDFASRPNRAKETVENVDNTAPQMSQEAKVSLPKAFPSNRTVSTLETVSSKLKMIFLDAEANSFFGAHQNKYFGYLNMLKNPFVIVAILLGYILAQTLQAFSDAWVSHWTSSPNSGAIRFAIVHSAFVLFRLALYALISWVHRLSGARIASLFHKAMLSAMTKSPVSFFETHSSGQILNHFASDQSKLDNDTYWVIRQFIDRVLAFCRVFLVVMTVSPAVIAILVPALYINYKWINYYSFVSVKMDTHEQRLQSPALTWIAETIRGVETIRAFDLERSHTQKFQKAMNNLSQLRFSNVQMEKLRSIATQVIGIGVSAPVMLWVLMNPSFDASTAGLIFYYAESVVSDMCNLMHLINALRTRVNAVARMSSFSQIEAEKYEPDQPFPVPLEWPQKGALSMQGVHLRYGPTSPWVLQNVSFDICGGEKIGIVGRTGAGKSSLVSTLFRLSEIDQGCISIDGINLAEIPLRTLRERLLFIPQVPILFGGTIRQNLDPFNESEDKEIWDALRVCELARVVEHQERQLEHQIGEQGKNFSLGERQLFCLARAILKKFHHLRQGRTPILVMDEVTSSVDVETDLILQKTIRQEFSRCTILVIAHRLQSIIDCNRILVLDVGQVVEFDAPFRLLSNPNSRFHSLVQDTGHFQVLFQAAKRAFESQKG